MVFRSALTLYAHAAPLGPCLATCLLSQTKRLLFLSCIYITRGIGAPAYHRLGVCNASGLSQAMMIAGNWANDQLEFAEGTVFLRHGLLILLVPPRDGGVSFSHMCALKHAHTHTHTHTQKPTTLCQPWRNIPRLITSWLCAVSGFPAYRLQKRQLQLQRGTAINTGEEARPALAIMELLRLVTSRTEAGPTEPSAGRNPGMRRRCHVSVAVIMVECMRLNTDTARSVPHNAPIHTANLAANGRTAVARGHTSIHCKDVYAYVGAYACMRLPHAHIA